MLSRCRYLIYFVFFCAYSVQAKDTILWQTYHHPPAIIQHGPAQGKGFVQQVLNLVIVRLTDYEHRMPLTSFARALADIKSGKFACHPAVFKTPEREEFMHFSQPMMINPTNKLISLKGKFSQFVENNQIQLRDVTEFQNYTYALVKGRSYTETIDREIRLYLNKDKIFPMSNLDLSPIFQMIELGRVDATIAYQFELNHYAKDMKKPVEQFDVHHLVGLPKYSIGHIACPKNEWGRNLISKIDVILDEIKPTEAYKYALTYWFPSERNNPEFIHFYQTEFLHP